MKYLIVIEETKTGVSACFPDVDGYIVAGKIKQDVEQNMQEAMEFHLEGLLMESQTIPHPHTYSNYVEVEATNITNHSSRPLTPWLNSSVSYKNKIPLLIIFLN